MKKIGKKIVLLVAVVAVVLLLMVELHQEQGQEVTATAPVRLSEWQLILDAGHGGEDGGAVSVTGVAESTINLSITLKIDQLLGLYGVCPVLLRNTDISLHDPQASTLREKKVSDLKNRVSTIESISNAVLISIHQNTFTNKAYHGAQVFYRDGEESLALAQQTQDTLRRGVDPDNQRSPSKISDSIYLMKHITCPAILVECGFLSNPTEEGKLRNNSYQTQLAVCIVSAWLQCGKIQGGNLQTPVL